VTDEAEDGQSVPLTLVDGLVPGTLIGTGGGLLLGVVSGDAGQVAAFVGGVGAIALALGVLAWLSAGSLADGDLAAYAGDREFTVTEARRTALRLAGLGGGLLFGAAVTVGVL
jgi:hypothetical protein